MQLSLLTSVLAKGKLKILKSPKRKSIFPLFKFPSFGKKPSLPKMLPPVWLFPPGPIYPPGFHGPPGFGPGFGPRFGPGFRPAFGAGFGPGTGIHGIPALLPPLPPPPPPKVPDFLKSKLVDPKDACVLKMLCEFEFKADKLGGGDLEKLLLGMVGSGGKKQLNFAFRRRRDIGDFWINIQKKDKDENHGSELCENRYPTCYYSPIFSGSRLSILHKRKRRAADPYPTRSELSYNQESFVDQVVKRIWQLYHRLSEI